MWAAVESQTDQVALAALAIVATLAGVIVLLVKTYQQSRAANAAVNNIGPGDHSLWDQVTFIREDVSALVDAQRQFSEKGWSTLPDDIGTSARLTETIRHLQHAAESNTAEHSVILEQLSELSRFVKGHDAWERQAKYGDSHGDQ